MKQFGDFFPENPQSLDELLEAMAQRMAQAQTMLNSMTPEQRAQLQQLSEQLLEDMDLRWQMDQLSQNLQSMFPGWVAEELRLFGTRTDGFPTGDAVDAGSGRPRPTREFDEKCQ